MSEPVTNLKMFAAPAELRRAPVVECSGGLGVLTDKLSAFAEGKTPLWWDYKSEVGQTIVLCRLFEWAFGPRNPMKN